MYFCLSGHGEGSLAVREKCPYLELFWSVFSRIRIEYGQIRSIFTCSVQMRKMRTKITPNTDTFYAVLDPLKYLWCSFFAKIINSFQLNIEKQTWKVKVTFCKRCFKTKLGQKCQTLKIKLLNILDRMVANFKNRHLPPS